MVEMVTPYRSTKSNEAKVRNYGFLEKLNIKATSLNFGAYMAVRGAGHGNFFPIF